MRVFVGVEWITFPLRRGRKENNQEGWKKGNEKLVNDFCF